MPDGHGAVSGRKRAHPPGRLQFLSPMQILLVADGRWVVVDVIASLSDPCYEVTAVSDSRDIVKACSDAGADVVVTDMQIGAMGGMAVIREIRAAIAAGILPPMPTVLLLDREADAFIAGRAGAYAWIRKPFGALELRGLLNQLTGDIAGVDMDALYCTVPLCPQFVLHFH